MPTKERAAAERARKEPVKATAPVKPSASPKDTAQMAEEMGAIVTAQAALAGLPDTAKHRAVGWLNDWVRQFKDSTEPAW